MEEYNTIQELLDFVLIECGEMMYEFVYRKTPMGDNVSGNTLTIGETCSRPECKYLSLQHIIYAFKLSEELFGITFDQLDISCATDDGDYRSLDLSEMEGLLCIHFGKVEQVKVPESVIVFSSEYDIDYEGFSKSNTMDNFYKYTRISDNLPIVTQRRKL